MKNITFTIPEPSPDCTGCPHASSDNLWCQQFLVPTCNIYSRPERPRACYNASIDPVICAIQIVLMIKEN